jgi:hypothetical protein
MEASGLAVQQFYVKLFFNCASTRSRVNKASCFRHYHLSVVKPVGVMCRAQIIDHIFYQRQHGGNFPGPGELRTMAFSTIEQVPATDISSSSPD